MKKLFKGFRKKSGPKRPIIIISGLPRSGTSMMMKMLEEGGVPVVTDKVRSADVDNPNGYFELEAVKLMSDGNIDWLDDAGGKAIKVISALLEYLPSRYEYKIIFMERNIREVLASQKKMLDNRQEVSSMNDFEVEERFMNHVSTVKAWLVRQPNMEILYVSYNMVMKDPILMCGKIVDFLGIPLDYDRMVTVPNERLYRNRKVLS